MDTNFISYVSFILNRYNKDLRILDKMGIDEVIKALITINGLEDYIKHINYSIPANDSANMSYSYFKKTINVSPDFIKGVKRSSKKMLDFFKIPDDTITINFDIVHSILHEVMHAKQYKLLDETKEGIIKEVLIKSLTGATYNEADNKKRALKFAKKTNDMNIYQLMPSELNAEIEAMKQIRNIIESIKIDDKYKYINMYDLRIKLLEMNSYTKKFIFISSPVEKYVKYRRRYMKDDINIDRKEIYKIDLDTRLSYGLPIKLSEYNNMENEIKDNIGYLYKK